MESRTKGRTSAPYQIRLWTSHAAREWADGKNQFLASSCASVTLVTEDDLPILGEPLPVELANTRYGQGEDAIDFLGTAALAELWLGALPEGMCARARPRINSRTRRQLVSLRDAVWEVVTATVDGSDPNAACLHIINVAAVRAPRRRALRLVDGLLHLEEHREGTAFRCLFATLADEAITFLAGPSRQRLRRCPGPECSMFFVQSHHLRGYCHESCSHRARQATYYRRQATRRSSHKRGARG